MSAKKALADLKALSGSNTSRRHSETIEKIFNNNSEIEKIMARYQDLCDEIEIEANNSSLPVNPEMAESHGL